jgi:peptidyl-tRNA hydrolase
LKEFKGKEKKIFERMIKKGAEAVVYALNEGIEKAMNKYNQKSR